MRNYVRKGKLTAAALITALIVTAASIAGTYAYLNMNNPRRPVITSLTNTGIEEGSGTLAPTPTPTNTGKGMGLGEPRDVETLSNMSVLGELINAALSTQVSSGWGYVQGIPMPLLIKYGVPPPATFTGPTATVPKPVSSPPHSSTNVQVPGVDEADIVKNDGTYLYVVGRTNWEPDEDEAITQVSIIKAYPPSELGIASTIPVEGYVPGLFVYGNRLAIINVSWTPLRIYYVVKEGASYVIKPSHPSRTESTSILLYDIGDKASPKLVGKVTVSGWYLTSRMVEGVTYLITTYWAGMPRSIGIVKTLRINYPSINGNPLPPKDVGLVKNPEIMPWVNTYVVITALNLSTGAHSSKAYLLPRPDTTYVSKDGIYLLSSRWGVQDFMLKALKKAVLPALPIKYRERISEVLANSSEAMPERVMEANEILSQYVKEGGLNASSKIVAHIYAYIEKELVDTQLQTTYIFKFRFQGLKVALQAYGEVKGEVTDQFAMHEEGKHFVLATTATTLKALKIAGVGWGWLPVPMPEYTEVNNVYILNSTDLKPVGNLTGLAPGEKVYAARFVGKYLYLVTYRKVDPLFAVNLSNPSKPQVVGYVKMPGYSEYLHPYMQRYLIGVGYLTDSEGRVKGVKVTLYDVRNPSNITVLSQVNITAPWTSTPVAWDHKAFLINTLRKYLAIPVRVFGSGGESSYVYVIKIRNTSLEVLGRIKQGGVIRTAYIGNYLYTISQQEVLASSLSNMQTVNSLKLP